MPQNGTKRIDLEMLEQLAMAATPGPWQFDDNEEVIQGHCVKTGVFDYCFCNDAEPYDAAFIAAANPSAILELCAEVRRLVKCCGNCDHLAISDIDGTLECTIDETLTWRKNICSKWEAI